MKPAWDQLGDEFAGSSSVLIGDVDCTADGEEMCTKFGVQGYPTIKYFKDGDAEGEPYNGGRDFDTLAEYVRENLEKQCDVETGDNCTERETEYAEKMKAKTSEERVKQIDRLKKMRGDSMKAELKRWINQRLNILQRLEGGGEEGETKKEEEL